MQELNVDQIENRQWQKTLPLTTRLSQNPSQKTPTVTHPSNNITHQNNNPLNPSKHASILHSFKDKFMEDRLMTNKTTLLQLKEHNDVIDALRAQIMENRDLSMRQTVSFETMERPSEALMNQLDLIQKTYLRKDKDRLVKRPSLCRLVRRNSTREESVRKEQIELTEEEMKRLLDVDPILQSKVEGICKSQGVLLERIAKLQEEKETLEIKQRMADQRMRKYEATLFDIARKDNNLETQRQEV